MSANTTFMTPANNHGGIMGGRRRSHPVEGSEPSLTGGRYSSLSWSSRTPKRRTTPRKFNRRDWSSRPSAVASVHTSARREGLTAEASPVVPVAIDVIRNALEILSDGELTLSIPDNDGEPTVSSRRESADSTIISSSVSLVNDSAFDLDDYEEEEEEAAMIWRDKRNGDDKAESHTNELIRKRELCD